MAQSQQDKIAKLKDLYDLEDPKDLFVLIPQEMEVAEIKGMANDWDGLQKKQTVMHIIMSIAVENGIDLDAETLGTFIDIINNASKGKYALNKVKS